MLPPRGDIDRVDQGSSDMAAGDFSTRAAVFEIDTAGCSDTGVLLVV